MTDKELLELAAKASGYKVVYTEPSVVSGKVFQCFFDGEYQIDWNPLTDDGDAFRLAVKFGIQVRRDDDVVWCNRERFGFDDDPYATTRRAIVRAAAEIAKVGADKTGEA